MSLLNFNLKLLSIFFSISHTAFANSDTVTPQTSGIKILCSAVVGPSISSASKFLDNMKPIDPDDISMRSAYIHNFRVRLTELSDQKSLDLLRDDIFFAPVARYFDFIVYDKDGNPTSGSPNYPMSDKRSQFLIKHLGWYKEGNKVRPPQDLLDMFAHLQLYIMSYENSFSSDMKPGLIYFRNLENGQTEVKLISPGVDPIPSIGDGWQVTKAARNDADPKDLAELEELALKQRKFLVFLPSFINDMLRVIN